MLLKEKYDNSTVRRRDRLLGYEKALELLEGGEYGFLAFGGASGYGIPLNFVLSGNRIYFHCAPEGEKLRRLAGNQEVCFCVVGHTAPQAAKFTTLYESVLVFGRLSLVEEEEELMRALECLVEKYSPDYKEIGKKYAEKSFHRTAVLRLDMERFSGKSKE